MELLKSDASAADASIFTMTQKHVMSAGTGVVDPKIISIASNGSISISTVNAKAGTYNLILRIHSTKNALDTGFLDVSFVVTILKYPCTQVFTDPTFVASTTYYIKTPSVQTVITFAGLSNMNCLFDTTLTLATGSAIDSTVFTYNPEVVAIDPVIDTIYSVTSTPTFVVNTGDISKEATYNFKMTVFSRSSPTDAVFKTYNFSVVLIDNPCVGSLTGIPANNAYDLTYTAQTKNCMSHCGYQSSL